ncbi:MAG: hypothetical protein ACPGRZ_03275, partial [Alphaproteobacteria bacterium]
GAPLDWDRVRDLAAAGRFLKPAGVVFALLRELGLPADGIPEDLIRRPRGIAAGPFERLVRDYTLFFSADPSSLRVLERELTLCTEPRVALHNALLRLKGLIRKRNGLPEGFNAE